MPSLSFLGNSFLLACCGSFLSPGENTTKLQNFGKSRSESEIKFGVSNLDQLDGQNNTQQYTTDSSSLIPKKQPISRIQFDNGSHIDININFPLNENSVGGVTIKTLTGHNILQINIFNNGAPITSPTIQSEETNNASLLNSLVTESEDDKSGTSLPSWKTSVVTQRPIKDSDGSGTEHPNGITSETDYLDRLGIGVVGGIGNDIANFTKID